MCYITMVMTYNDVKAKLKQHKEAISISLNNTNKNMEVSITLNYGQIKELVDEIYAILEHTDITKIDTDYVGSIEIESSYDDEVALIEKEDFCRQKYLSFQEKEKSKIA